jgi:hypothetical protein
MERRRLGNSSITYCLLNKIHIYYTFTHRRIKMFTPHFFIESFQSTKKLVTDQVFKDPALNKAAHAYIDAQTQFAKMAVNNTIDMAKYSVESISKVLFPKKDSAA